MDCAAAMGKFHGSDGTNGVVFDLISGLNALADAIRSSCKDSNLQPVPAASLMTQKSPARFRQLLAPGDGKFNAKSAWPREWVDERL